MKFVLALILATLAYALGTRDWDRDWRSGGTDDDGGLGSRTRLGGSRPCLLVRGYVRCGDESDVHDGKTVVVRFVDGTYYSICTFELVIHCTFHVL